MANAPGLTGLRQSMALILLSAQTWKALASKGPGCGTVSKCICGEKSSLSSINWSLSSKQEAGVLAEGLNPLDQVGGSSEFNHKEHT